jgi:DNA-binding NarL/FixJ family response regulator
MVDPAVTTSSAVVIAGDEETRVLLRGLLRLHHFRVDGEAEGATQGLELIREHHPTLVVADVNLAEGSPTVLVAEARRASPQLRVILVAPASRPPAAPASPEQGPDVVLLRPFRIRQFAEALVPPSPPSETASA